MATEFFWLIEARCLESSVPSYYAGYCDDDRLGIPAQTQDPLAAPRWLRKADADVVIQYLLGGFNFHWEAVEHGFIVMGEEDIAMITAMYLKGGFLESDCLAQKSHLIIKFGRRAFAHFSWYPKGVKT